MKKIGLMIAMDKELKLFTKFINFYDTKTIHKRTFHLGRYNNNELIVVVSGMGNVNAALCTSDLINTFSADLIINIGVSGGLTAALEIGDFVVGDDIVYHDVWCGTPCVIGQVMDLPAIYHSNQELSHLLPEFKHGMICCGDVFVEDQQTYDNIITKFPQALAVDMESAAIAQTCYLYDTPMISVRQISDTPGVEHSAEQYYEFWKNAPKQSASVLQKILEKLK